MDLKEVSRGLPHSCSCKRPGETLAAGPPPPPQALLPRQAASPAEARPVLVAVGPFFPFPYSSAAGAGQPDWWRRWACAGLSAAAVDGLGGGVCLRWRRDDGQGARGRHGGYEWIHFGGGVVLGQIRVDLAMVAGVRRVMVAAAGWVATWGGLQRRGSGSWWCAGCYAAVAGRAPASARLCAALADVPSFLSWV